MSFIPSWAGITMLVCGIIAVISGGVVAFIWTRPRSKDKKCRKSIANGSYIPSEDLLKFWEIDSDRAYGYAHCDEPGCYLLFTYNSSLPNTKKMETTYSGVYVGASELMLHDARGQIRGRGVEEIFKDLKLGKSAYVKCMPCSVDEMEAKRAELIERYNAEMSYNKIKVAPKKKKKRR